MRGALIMAKYIFTSQEVPHQFAADPQAYCSNSNRSLRADSGVLWSYQQPIAVRHGDMILISADSFSVTTGKHQSWARNALCHLKTLHVPSLKALRGCITEKAFAEWIAARMAEMDRIRESMVKMRAEHKKTHALRQIAELETVCAYVWAEVAKQRTAWQDALKVKAKSDKADAIRRYASARNQLESGLEYAECILSEARGRGSNGNHGLQSWRSLDGAAKDIRRIDSMSAVNGLGIGGSATFEHAAKLMGKKWAKECIALALEIHQFADALQPEIDALRADYDRTEQLADSERLVEWLAGGNAAPRGTVVLRVIGDEVQTSKGARVPLADGMAIAALAKSCRDSGKGLDMRNRRVGNYHGNSIASNGTVTIGCHTIQYDAITDCVVRYEESRA